MDTKRSVSLLLLVAAVGVFAASASAKTFAIKITDETGAQIANPILMAREVGASTFASETDQFYFSEQKQALAPPARQRKPAVVITQTNYQRIPFWTGTRCSVTVAAEERYSVEFERHVLLGRKPAGEPILRIEKGTFNLRSGEEGRTEHYGVRLVVND